MTKHLNVHLCKLLYTILQFLYGLLSPSIITILLIMLTLVTLESHKMREVHSSHSSLLSLDVKQGSSHHVTVLYGSIFQVLAPGTEFNLNCHCHCHHKMESCARTVVGTSHRQLNSERGRSINQLKPVLFTCCVQTQCRAQDTADFR